MLRLGHTFICFSHVWQMCPVAILVMMRAGASSGHLLVQSSQPLQQTLQDRAASLRHTFNTNLCVVSFSHSFTATRTLYLAAIPAEPRERCPRRAWQRLGGLLCTL